jgi:hypothetical protein
LFVEVFVDIVVAVSNIFISSRVCIAESENLANPANPNQQSRT